MTLTIKYVQSNDQILSFDYLKCGTYQLKGRMIKKVKNNSSSFYFQIYPTNGSRKYSRSRLISLRHPEKKEISRLEDYSDLSLTIEGKYHQDSRKNNYITLNKIIGPSTHSDLYDSHKVIKKIKENPCH